MLAADLYAVIEKTAPLYGAAKWDLSGLQVASTRKYVFHLAVCLDPLPKTINQAISLGADCVLSHHPLSLSPGLPNKRDNYFETLKLLFGANIALYAAHTSLDANPDGPALWLAEALGLKDWRVLDETRPPDSVHPHGLGFGCVGRLPEAAALDSICSKAMKLCRIHTASLSGPVNAGKISSVAFCGGSGASLLPLAESAGAELYITGDMKYHAALEAAIPVLDVGHFGLEEEMMRRFADFLGKTLEIEVDFVAGEPPFAFINDND